VAQPARSGSQAGHPRCGPGGVAWPPAAIRGGLGWLAILAALATPALADPEPTGLQPANGEGERRRIPAARVTALRMAELPEDPSSFTTVLESSDFQGEHRSAAELLSRSVGVQVRDLGGPGQLAEVSIRGSTGQQVVVLLAGVRLNSAQSGAVDLSTIPFDLVERIEVSRGGGSVQVGSDAVGGVVNIITRRPGAEPRSSFSLSGGSFGTWEGSVSYDARVGPGRDLVLGYQGFRTKGDWDFQSTEVVAVVDSPSAEFHRVNNRSESHAGLLRLGRDLGESARLSASNHLLFSSRGQPGLDTGAGELGAQSPRAHARTTRNVFDLLLELEDLAGGALRSELRASHRYDRGRFTDPASDFGPAIDSKRTNRATGLRAALEAEKKLARMEHLLSLSLEGRRDALESNDFGDPTRLVFGAFLQDELALFDRRVVLSPALRYDHSEGLGSEWVPRLGLVLAPLPWLRIKGNLERSYRVPSFDELFFQGSGDIRGNPNLEPEDARNADVGLEVAADRLLLLENLRLEASVFYSDIENSIVFQQVSPSIVQATNTNDARIRGVELAGSFGLLGWLQLSGNWTRLDVDPKGPSFDLVLEQGDRVLPGRAENEHSLRLQIGPPSGLFKLVGERHHTSQIPTSESGNSYVSARTVYHASAALDLAQLSPFESRWLPGSLIASVTGSNLGDRSVRDDMGFARPGRIVTFKLEGVW
jgi:outer membrane cobalamin receptor